MASGTRRSYKDNIKRNPILTRLVLHSYGHNLCMLVQKTKILADIPVEMETASMTAVEDYVGALKRVYVIENIDVWRTAI